MNSFDKPCSNTYIHKHPGWAYSCFSLNGYPQDISKSPSLDDSENHPRERCLENHYDFSLNQGYGPLHPDHSRRDNYQQFHTLYPQLLFLPLFVYCPVHGQ